MTQLQRAYSILECKAPSEKDGSFVFEGIATTPTADRVGDVVESMGVSFKNPMPLLWQHSHNEPVGTVEFGKPTKNGVPFKASIPLIAEAGRLKDRIDEAIQSVKYGLVRAVSIGFRALKDGAERMDDGGIRFTKTEVMELSLVTIPANSQAVITAIKSADQSARAVTRTPGVSGIQKARTEPIKLNVTRKVQK